MRRASWSAPILRSLRPAARESGSISRTVRGSRRGPSEIAALARAFNEMSDALARHEADLRASVARYRVLFERNFVGMFRMRPDGTVVECNEAFARILGYRSAAEASRHNAREFYAGAGVRDEVVRWLAATGSVEEFEAEARRHDGSVVPVMMSVRRVVEADGPVHEGILIDLSDRKRAEEATALRSVAELANVAAHEVNNPLAAVAGQLELMERRGTYDPELLRRAREATYRIRDIVAHMVRITRLEQAEGWSPGLPRMLDIRRSAPEEEP